MLLVQAETGLSTRVRGEENDFNLLHMQPGEITIERFAAPHGTSGYRPARSARFLRGSPRRQPTARRGVPSSVAVV